jgi:hypothetical protein
MPRSLARRAEADPEAGGHPELESKPDDSAAGSDD